jgi:Domain of unknown function (DUF4232)
MGMTWRRPGRLAPVLGGLAVLGAGLFMLAGCGRGAAFAVAPSRSASSHPSPASAVSPPSSGAPAHARQVQTGPDIQQWQEAGTTITSLWMDLEAGMIVQVTGESLDRDPRQGEISVAIINQASAGGHIGRYRGGAYPTPRKSGPVTLTGVTGSLATQTMVISFSYAGGTGKLLPRTGHFTIVPRPAACATSQLQITFTHQGGVAGDEGGYLRFANTGTAACRLQGWPAVGASVMSSAPRVLIRGSRIVGFFVTPSSVTVAPAMTSGPGRKRGSWHCRCGGAC